MRSLSKVWKIFPLDCQMSIFSDLQWYLMKITMNLSVMKNLSIQSMLLELLEKRILLKMSWIQELESPIDRCLKWLTPSIFEEFKSRKSLNLRELTSFILINLKALYKTISKLFWNDENFIRSRLSLIKSQMDLSIKLIVLTFTKFVKRLNESKSKKHRVKDFKNQRIISLKK